MIACRWPSSLAVSSRRLSATLSSVLLEGDEVAEPAQDAEPASVYGPLLDNAEARHDMVVLDGGSISSGSPWSEFCVQQADRILAVTAGGPVPDALRGRRDLRGCDLVAYEVAPGSGALEAWAALLDPIESHVVREAQRDSDLQRAARRLSGRSVGVVLSGGGARAFSHIGVLGGADSGRSEDRPRAGSEHGGIRRRAVRDGARRR